MARQIAFDNIDLEWIEFRVVPGQNAPALRAHGYLVNDAGDRLPFQINGWAGISAPTRTALTSALRTLLLERAAVALNVNASTLTIGPDGLIRPIT
jgi:hypothetical protein